MIKSTKLPLLLFLSLLFLASVSSTLGYSLIRVNSQSDHKQCFIHCEEQYGGDPQSVEQLVCEEICVLKELKRHQGDRGRHEGFWPWRTEHGESRRSERVRAMQAAGTGPAATVSATLRETAEGERKPTRRQRR